MATPEIDPGSAAKILDWMWAAVTALVAIVWKNLHDKLSDNRLEIDRHREDINKLFDKLEEHARRSEDRHHELLTALHQGLNSKADK